MSTRPQRRTSSLANQHPATPSAPPVVPVAGESTAGAEPVAAKRTGKRSAKAKPAANPQAAAAKAKQQTNFYADPDRLARVKAAFLRTRGPEAYDSFSEFIMQSLERTATELEARYNDGQPWEGETSLPAGRPVRS